MGDDSVLTLKVENASDATSKLGNSTNLKNNTKLADSNMYLKNTQKIHKVKTVDCNTNIRLKIHIDSENQLLIFTYKTI